MSSIEAGSGRVAVALLYQAEALHQHLRVALTDFGATLVYESATATFDRAQLDASGARVVVVNLDPQVDEEIDQIDDLLNDEKLQVIFNDGEVSSKLEGWDAARWARHLAAKILGVSEVHPPRPTGSESVAVRVRQVVEVAPTAPLAHSQRSAPESESVPVRVLPVARELPTLAPSGPPRPESVSLPVRHSAPEVPRAPAAQQTTEPSADDEMARAMAADTSESLARTREQLVTKLEPISIDVIAQSEAIAPYQSMVEETHTLMPQPVERAAAAAPEVPRDSNQPAASEEFATAELEAALQGFDFGGSSSTTLVNEDEGFDLTELAAFADIDFDAPESKVGAADVPAGLDDMLDSLQRAKLGENPPPSVLPKRALALDLSTPAPVAPRKAPGESREPSSGVPVVVAKKAPADKENPFASLLGDLDLSLTPVEEGHFLSAEVPAPTVNNDLDQFDLGGLSLEPLPGTVQKGPITGRANYRIDEPADKSPPVRPPIVEKLPPPKAADSRFSLEPLEAPLQVPSLDALPSPRQLPAAARKPAAVEEDFLGEFAALFAEDVDALGADSAHLRHVVVLGASIGGPEAVREFLGEIAPSTSATFLLAQHLGEEFVEKMVQQLAKATRLKVRMVGSGDKVNPGEVVIVPAAERLLLDRAGEVRLENLPEPSPYSPSIDQILFDVADRFGADASAIIFSGMAHDAIEGAKYLAERGGSIWAQDPSTCVVSSMIDGARAAGVVEFVGTPKDLARRLVTKFAA